MPAVRAVYAHFYKGKAMDWKNNQAVGVGAAVLLVVAVVVVFMWSKGSPEEKMAQQRHTTWLCKSTNTSFTVSETELRDLSNYTAYMVKFGVDTKCKACGKNDAVRAYYCQTCKQAYAYPADYSEALVMDKCPKGHEISEWDQ
jgi:hypothetical protein